ncbi:hypothetical protein Ancab_025415, partial [Ancistrocladus abbreviatus]
RYRIPPRHTQGRSAMINSKTVDSSHVDLAPEPGREGPQQFVTLEAFQALQN